jgi:hypothetical protein
MTPIDLSVDEYAALLGGAVFLMDVLEEHEIHNAAPDAPLPAGLLTCGEACQLVPAVIALVLKVHPELMEDGALEQAARSASSSSGERNLN